MPALFTDINLHPCLRKQRGAALMVMLVIIIIGSAAFLVSALSRAGLQIERDKITADALAQAKDALVGYASSVTLTSSGSARPGDLPCPDINNDGSADTPCSGNALGRLPWKTLGLSDLRDSSGERLWYAVSTNFKNSPRTTCTNSNLTGCLNSDTSGTISVFSSDGVLLNNGGGGTGAVAVIIAPGDVLQRQGGPLQDRSSAGTNTASNYLDIATVGAITQDNANFVDSSASNGFIQGRITIYDPATKTNPVILNDQLLVITQDNIIQPIQKRVAAEVKNCLSEYAANSQNQGPLPNQGYYPWAAARTVSGSSIVYNDSDRLEFGHIPDAFFAQTCSDTGGSNCNSIQNGGMTNKWGPACSLANTNWWVNWKEMVFYGLTHNLRPHNLGHNHACSNGTCLVINPPSTVADKQFVVIVAGKKIGTQVRSTNTDKSSLSNYLEGANANGATPFEQSPLTTTFNDTVVFQQ